MSRDWGPAVAKVNDEGRCRKCGRSDKKLEAAHTWHRGMGAPRGLNLMDPDLIIPLCGPVTDPSSCHYKFDNRKEDFLECLREGGEQWKVVKAAGTIARAYRRLAPVAFRDMK